MFLHLPEFFWIITYPLSVVWAFITFLRRLFLGGRGYQAKVAVICVGNLHSGGSSKTPVTLEILKHFKDRSPAVLSRGYGRNSKGNLLVNLNADQGPDFFGDEPWLLAKESGCPVWVGGHRGKLARIAEERNPGLLVMDDGFQNFSIKKDFRLICIQTDKTILTANTIPLGELRESLTAIKDASAVLLIKGHDETSHHFWRRYFENEWETLPCFEGKAVYEYPEELKTGRWIAFCGIANPNRFKTALESIGCDAFFHFYEDHHHYTAGDAKFLTALKEREGALSFVTTAKDAVKLEGKGASFFDGEIVDIIKMRVEVDPAFWKFLDASVLTRTQQ